jgi:hypothetical protein
LHQKIDLLLEDQIKALTDSKAQQYTFLNHLHEKIDTLSWKEDLG